MLLRDNIVVSALILISGIISVKAEFYFCLNGPQRVKNGECSAGIVLMKPIETRCAGMTKDRGTVSAMVQFNGSVCDESRELPESITGADKTGTLKQDAAFQVAEVQYSTLVTPIPESVGKTTALGICLSECLQDWIDPRIPQADEPPFDFGITSVSPEIGTEQQNITQGLLRYVMETLDPDQFPDSKADMRILDVFQEALNVLEKHCAPYLKPDFMKGLYAAHRFLILHPSAGELNDLAVWEHALIIGGLTKCKDNPSKFVIESETCGDPEEAQIKMINNIKPKLEAKSFRWGLFDFLVEAAWGAVEFAHGYCYKEYMNDLTFQHLLVKSIDALFPKKVQERWMYPAKEQSDMFWSSILGVKNIEMIMRNMDACIVAGRKFSPYKDRLGRPYERQPGTYTPTMAVATENKPKEHERGFKGNLDEYWDQYDANGGAKTAISGDGFCADDDASFTEALRVANGHCPPPEEDYNDGANDDDENEIDEE